MKLLNKTQVQDLERELLYWSYLNENGAYVDTQRLDDILTDLEDSYHTNVDFELRLIDGGKQ